MATENMETAPGTAAESDLDEDAKKVVTTHARRWLPHALQAAALIMAAGIAWGAVRQDACEAKLNASKVKDDLRGVADVQATLVTRVAVLESHQQVTNDKLSQISASLRDIDGATRSLHDNVLVLCQMSSMRDSCKK